MTQDNIKDDLGELLGMARDAIVGSGALTDDAVDLVLERAAAIGRHLQTQDQTNQLLAGLDWQARAQNQDADIAQGVMPLDYQQAALSEVQELSTAAVQYKWWSNSEHEIDVPNSLMELVDVFHFLLSLSLVEADGSVANAALYIALSYAYSFGYINDTEFEQLLGETSGVDGDDFVAFDGVEADVTPDAAVDVETDAGEVDFDGVEAEDEGDDGDLAEDGETDDAPFTPAADNTETEEPYVVDLTSFDDKMRVRQAILELTYHVSSGAPVSSAAWVAFWNTVAAFGFTAQQIDSVFNAKAVLNRFRTAHGNGAGTYVKVWNGVEDNYVLMQELAQHPEGMTAEEVQTFLESAYPGV